MTTSLSALLLDVEIAVLSNSQGLQVKVFSSCITAVEKVCDRVRL